MASVFTVPRNDIAAARAFYEAKGHLTDDEVRVLIKLQDDPSDLRAAMKAESWEVRRLSVSMPR
jgi:hypothetical protein